MAWAKVKMTLHNVYLDCSAIHEQISDVDARSINAGLAALITGAASGTVISILLLLRHNPQPIVIIIM